MRVLIDHSSPFLLAHGGFQRQIEQTAEGLRGAGLSVDFVRWWDDSQQGDVIHYFGRPTEVYVRLAQQKGFKVVIADLVTGLGSRSPLARFAQRVLIKTTQQMLPASFTARMGWGAFARADAIIALTSWEAKLMTQMFDAPPSRTHVVPNGVEELFLNAEPRQRGPWLICTATITERKRVLELARAAVLAETPIWIVGEPYSRTDPYAVRFEQFAKQHTQWIRYEGAVRDRARLAIIYREARGFVLLSTMESLSLSSLVAAACECPLLLSDLPWARSTFADAAQYCPIASPKKTAAALREFCGRPPAWLPKFKPRRWTEIGRELRVIYDRC